MPPHAGHNESNPLHRRRHSRRNQREAGRRALLGKSIQSNVMCDCRPLPARERPSRTKVNDFRPANSAAPPPALVVVLRLLAVAQDEINCRQEEGATPKSVRRGGGSLTSRHLAETERDLTGRLEEAKRCMNVRAADLPRLGRETPTTPTTTPTSRAHCQICAHH